jgi:broad specificity phosphatase PhoE
MDLLLIRHAQS